MCTISKLFFQIDKEKISVLGYKIEINGGQNEQYRFQCEHMKVPMLNRLFKK